MKYYEVHRSNLIKNAERRLDVAKKDNNDVLVKQLEAEVNLLLTR